MARRIADAQEAEAEEDEENDEEDVPVVPNSPRLNQLRAPRKWQPISLERLFAKTVKESLRARHGEQTARTGRRADLYAGYGGVGRSGQHPPDDGEVEIDDSEVYGE
jgi:hypothetical protein